MSLVHLMFLNYKPNIEASLIQLVDKFSLPYSLALMGLIRQISNGTMGMLRLPSPVPTPSVSLGVGYHLRYCLFLVALSDGNTDLTGQDNSGAVCPSLTAFRMEVGGSPKFPQKPNMHLPCSTTPVGHSLLTMTATVLLFPQAGM